MMKQKVLYLVPHKRHLLGLCESLSKNFAITGFLGPQAGELPEERFMRIARLPLHGFGLYSLLAALQRETQASLYIRGLGRHFSTREQAAIIAFDIYHWYTLQCLAHKKKHPDTRFVIWSESRSIPQNLLSRIAFKLFLGALQKQQHLIDKIFVYTEEGRAFMETALPGLPVVIMPAPVDTDVFYPNDRADFMPDGMLRILMNARFVGFKRHGDMLRALQILAEKGVAAHVTFIGHEGHLREQIKEEAGALGLTQSITFLPSVPLEQMRDIYLAHDVLVLPSRNEAIGMVVPEAMACGIPTVTSDSVGANTYVEEGVTGFIYPTGDPGSLAAALEKMADRDTLARFGAAARERIEMHFSARRVADHFSAALDLA